MIKSEPPGATSRYANYSKHFLRGDPSHALPISGGEPLRMLPREAHWLPPKQASILDIGCGLGNALLDLHTRGYKNLTGVDFSDDMIRLARSQLPSEINLQSISSTIDWLKTKAEAYDFIILQNAIEHVPPTELVELLQSIRRSLRQSGRLFVSTPNMGSLFAAYLRYVDFTHEIGFTEHSLVQVIEIAGFPRWELLPELPNRNLTLTRSKPWRGWDLSFYIRKSLSLLLVKISGVTPRPTRFRGHLDAVAYNSDAG